MATKQLRLRPSAASRWIACPASARLCEQVPKRPAGEAANIGTAIHALAETCFQLDSDPMQFVGKTIEGITLTQENCEYALQHMKAIWAIQDELGNVKVEVPVKLFEDNQVLLQGTADVVGHNHTKMTVADLKTGKGWVDADTEQLKIYALGAMATLNLPDIEEIEFQIIQPHHGEKRIHFMTMQELNDWEDNVLRPAMEDAISDSPTLRPSDSACQWCDAKTICPAQQKQFEIVAANTDITAMKKEEIAEVMKTLTPEQISAILDKAPMVEKFIAAVQEHALNAMEKDGLVLPGWQLASKRATRKWIDGDAAREKLTSIGLSDKDIFETSLITPAAAEKLLPKEQRVILDELTVKVSSGLTLARDRSLSQ
jgi:hypothetical protein